MLNCHAQKTIRLSRASLRAKLKRCPKAFRDAFGRWDTLSCSGLGRMDGQKKDPSVTQTFETSNIIQFFSKKRHLLLPNFHKWMANPAQLMSFGTFHKHVDWNFEFGSFLTKESYWQVLRSWHVHFGSLLCCIDPWPKFYRQTMANKNTWLCRTWSINMAMSRNLS